ncbi:hypothetical protein D3C78_1517130 [compost metagenome]
MVIEVSFRFMNLIRSAKNGRSHILCRRLAIAACYPHNAHKQLAAVRCSQPLQGHKRIAHDKQREIRK